MEKLSRLSFMLIFLLQTETEYEGATAASTDTRSLRHSLSWPESTRRGKFLTGFKKEF